MGFFFFTPYEVQSVQYSNQLDNQNVPALNWLCPGGCNLIRGYYASWANYSKCYFTAGVSTWSWLDHNSYIGGGSVTVLQPCYKIVDACNTVSSLHPHLKIQKEKDTVSVTVHKLFPFYFFYDRIIIIPTSFINYLQRRQMKMKLEGVSVHTFFTFLSFFRLH